MILKAASLATMGLILAVGCGSSESGTTTGTLGNGAVTLEDGNGAYSAALVDTFMSDLEAKGFGTRFVNRRAAVRFAQNFCERYKSGETSVDDELERTVAIWCGDQDLLSVEVSEIPE